MTSRTDAARRAQERKNRNRQAVRAGHRDKYADRANRDPDGMESLLSALLDQYGPEVPR